MQDKCVGVRVCARRARWGSRVSGALVRIPSISCCYSGGKTPAGYASWKAGSEYEDGQGDGAPNSAGPAFVCCCFSAVLVAMVLWLLLFTIHITLLLSPPASLESPPVDKVGYGLKLELALSIHCDSPCHHRSTI